MLNITTSVQILRDAETIRASKSLSEKEKDQLLVELRTTVPDTMVGIPNHATLVRDAISRMIDNGRRDAGHPAVQTQKQSGKTKGGKKSPEVAAGTTEEAAQAAKGPTSGVEEQTEDY